MQPGNNVRILSICDDEGILLSREMVLRHEGYEVESISSFARMPAEWIRTFQIAILCHSIGPNRATRIADSLRRENSEIRLLRIHTAESGLDCVYDKECETFRGPVQLLESLQALSSVVDSGKKRAPEARLASPVPASSRQSKRAGHHAR